MNAIIRGFSFLLWASLIIFWPPHALSQSSEVNACATLAAKIITGNSGQVIPSASSIFHQIIQRQVYLKCLLQVRGQMPAPATSAAASASNFITFDVPGSTCLPSFALCTHPTAISAVGAVTGLYADANGALHGFLRAPNGTFTNIDPPGSGGSFPSGINPEAAIVGYYCNAITCHGFLRATGGTFTLIDVPDGVATFACCINPAGAVTGAYDDANFVGHGFLRAPNGTFTTFDAPGAVNGTAPTAINLGGVIIGAYYDTNGVSHGFLRTGWGTFTTFDPPRSIYTNPTGINLEGAITGYYQDASGVLHGFLRAWDGTFTTFDAPGSEFQTYANAINLEGAIVGYDQQASGGLHGFLRAPNGTFTMFDPPGSIGTWNVPGINPAGAITGSYLAPSTPCCLEHGFLYWPQLWVAKTN
jgi:hypothetical protein